MEVILLKEVPGLGIEGDIKNVKDGFARNYLLPGKLAVKKSAISLSILEKQKSEIEKKNQEIKSAYNEIKNKIDGIDSLTIKVKTGEGDKIYGTVTNADVSKKLKTEFSIDIDKKKILIREHIKMLGIYPVFIHLMDGVASEIKLQVEREE
ncbi:MAG: 50S ribosomal protein L9 [Spirochaetes bacterium GWF1_41_5]|nr:MAG: 50S ribosomal protein L9 [Spirochaetes bacterium GWF1_41_5]HBE03430.1 50S ribosomal protein L9 [Spirochaetia bacterium]